MPFETQVWAKNFRTGSPARKAILMALAEHADESNSCFPSQATLAYQTEQSVRSVRSHLDALEQMGAIRREHRHRGEGGGSGRTSDRFVLLLQAADFAAEVQAADLDGLSGRSRGSSGRSRRFKRQPLADELPRTASVEQPENCQGEPTSLDRAKSVLDVVFAQRRDAGKPRPANYMAARSAIKAMVEAGWSDEALTAAALRVPTITIGWLEGELNGSKRSTNGARAPERPHVARDAPEGLVDVSRFFS